MRVQFAAHIAVDPRSASIWCATGSQGFAARIPAIFRTVAEAVTGARIRRKRCL